MPIGYTRLLTPCLLFSLLASGCAQLSPADTAAQSRLDELTEKLDQSLSNQAAVDSRLQQQGRQLDQQQVQLQALGRDLGLALQEPAPDSCPEVAECPALDSSAGKIVVGGLEDIWLSELGIAISARIDTGLQTSSLDVRNIEQFERDGKPWVRFEIVNSSDGKTEQVERKLRRTVGIVQAGASQSKRRPVVKMGVVIGNVSQTAEFSLSERTHRDYQAQIGRSILNDVMLVDVSRKNIAPYQRPRPTSAGAGDTR